MTYNEIVAACKCYDNEIKMQWVCSSGEQVHHLKTNTKAKTGDNTYTVKLQIMVVIAVAENSPRVEGSPLTVIKIDKQSKMINSN